MPILEAIVLRANGIRMGGVCLDPLSGVKIPPKGQRGSYPRKLRNNCDLGRNSGRNSIAVNIHPVFAGQILTANLILRLL